VVTTGATLESCARTLHEAGASAISIACIAAALRNY
jgi:predicted amidophosphoribosyltransferase